MPKCMLTVTLYRLQKSLYGLKQPPLLWYRKLKHCLTDVLRYTVWACDSLVFIKRCVDVNLSIIMANVDDLIFISGKEETLQKDVKHLLSHFEVTVEELN